MRRLIVFFSLFLSFSVFSDTLTIAPSSPPVSATLENQRGQCMRVCYHSDEAALVRMKVLSLKAIVMTNINHNINAGMASCLVSIPSGRFIGRWHCINCTENVMVSATSSNGRTIRARAGSRPSGQSLNCPQPSLSECKMNSGCQ